MERNKIIIFQDRKIRRIWHNDEWYYSVADIVTVLTDTVNATDYIKKLRKRDDELAKGWGQIVTPLEIETSGGFKTTENAEDTENYYPSVISSVVDYSYLNSYIRNKSKNLFYSVNELVTICNQLKLPSSDGNYVIIEPEKQRKLKKGGQHVRLGT